MALTMLGLMTKGLDEHPKQSYSVGRNFVDQAAQANSGKLERSEADVPVTTKPPEFGFVALIAVTGFPIAFDAFCSLGLTVDFRAAFGGLVGARGWPIVVLSLPPSSIRTNWIMLACLFGE
jgi:hypothetical protein